MNEQQIKVWLLENDYHMEDGEYVHTYNSVRHWAQVRPNGVRMYSVYEGTAGDEPIFDTDFLDYPSKETLNKLLAKSHELKWNG